MKKHSIAFLFFLALLPTTYTFAQRAGVRITPIGAGPRDTITITVYPELAWPRIDGDPANMNEPPRASIYNSDSIYLHAGVWIDTNVAFTPRVHIGFDKWQLIKTVYLYGSWPSPVDYATQFVRMPDGTFQKKFVPSEYFGFDSAGVPDSAVIGFNFVLPGGLAGMNGASNDVWLRSARDFYIGSLGLQLGADFDVRFPIGPEYSGIDTNIIIQTGTGSSVRPSNATSDGMQYITFAPARSSLGAALPATSTPRLIAFARLLGRQDTLVSTPTNTSALLNTFTRQPDGTYRLPVHLPALFGLAAMPAGTTIGYRVAVGDAQNPMSLQASPSNGTNWWLATPGSISSAPTAKALNTNRLALHPNPATKTLFVQSLVAGTLRLTALNARAITRSFALQPGQTSIDLSTLVCGFYLAQIGNQSQKVVVE